MIFEPLVRSMQTVHLSCIKITTISKWTEPSFHLSLVTPSGVSEMIFEPMRCLAQTVHPSCTDTYTVSRRTEMRFYRTHVT
jgi:hypothetical protein